MVVFVYSVADRQTFSELDRFFNDATYYISNCYTIIVAANFQDVDQSQHQVTSAEAQEWVNKHNPTMVDGKSVSVLYVEVSAKSCKGIQTLRKMLVDAYMEEAKPALHEVRCD